MAERKAVNKYYPPDWDPRKGSVNKRVGQHPLRDRARKLSQGILVIRFELPYNIWCGGCGSHVGMGVRYNAEKSKVGNYYTTPIYKFRMKCHLCDNYFEIQTDPKNHDYVILSGARRKEQRWDPVANEQIVPEDKATHKKMVMDAMYKLEHGSDDVQKGQDKKKSLAELETSRFSMRDDYMLNRMARDKFRAEKKQLKSEAEADQAILDRGALDIELLDETDEDRRLAGLLKYSVTSSFEEKQREKRHSIEQRPLFEPLASPTPMATPSSSSSSSSHSSSSDPKTDSNFQLKGRLSQVLKMYGKDPFKIDKSSTMVKTSRPKLPQLGIRIKSSKVPKSDKYKRLKSQCVKSEMKSLKKAISIERKNCVTSICTTGAANAELDSQSSKVCEKKHVDITKSENTCSYNSSTISDSKPSHVSQHAMCENPEVNKGSSDKDATKNISCNVSDLPSPSMSSIFDTSPACELHSAGSSQKVMSPVISSPSSGQNSSLMSLIQSYDDGNEDDESDGSSS